MILAGVLVFYADLLISSAGFRKWNAKFMWNALLKNDPTEGWQPKSFFNFSICSSVFVDFEGTNLWTLFTAVIFTLLAFIIAVTCQASYNHQLTILRTSYVTFSLILFNYLQGVWWLSFTVLTAFVALRNGAFKGSLLTLIALFLWALVPSQLPTVLKVLFFYIPSSMILLFTATYGYYLLLEGACVLMHDIHVHSFTNVLRTRVLRPLKWPLLVALVMKCAVYAWFHWETLVQSQNLVLQLVIQSPVSMIAFWQLTNLIVGTIRKLLPTGMNLKSTDIFLLVFVTTFSLVLSGLEPKCARRCESIGLFYLSFFTLLKGGEPSINRVALQRQNSSSLKSFLRLGFLTMLHVLSFVCLQIVSSDSGFYWFTSVAEICILLTLIEIIPLMVESLHSSNDGVNFETLFDFQPILTVFKLFLFSIAFITVVVHCVFISKFNPYECVAMFCFFHALMDWLGSLAVVLGLHPFSMAVLAQQELQRAPMRPSPAPRKEITYRVPKLEELIRLNDICSICRDDMVMVSTTVVTACGHFYHRKCISDALTVLTDQVCPLCRSKL